MFYPELHVLPEKIHRTSVFGGLNTGENPPFNEFSEMENLTGDSFPLMKVREKRGIFSDSSGSTCFSLSSPVTAMVDTAEGILIATEDEIYIDGKKIEGITLLKNVKNRNAVPVGRNVFIVPDGIYIKFTENGAEAAYCSKELSAEASFYTMCLSDGTDIFPHYYGSFPENASAGELLAVSSPSSMELYSYSGKEWVKTDDLYIRLVLTSEVSVFSPGQSLYIEVSDELFRDGYYTVKNITETSLILEGSIPSEGDNVNIRVKSEIPLMDFAVEHNNRIWGCRFGESNHGEFVNEIYSSKLGDPASWYSYSGISTDSYTASLGCSGEFTGAVSTGSEVLFFKENHIIRVFGSTPSDFQVISVPARGVEKGAHRSVVNLSERIFYKNSEGIMLYDGTYPVNISGASYKNRFTAHAAGGIDGKYYISMTDSKNRRGLFVFDTVTGLMHREDDLFGTEFIFQRNGVLIFAGEREDGVRFFVTSFEKNKDIKERLISEEPLCLVTEEAVSFYALTGNTAFPERENERLRCIFLTLELGEDSFLEISLEKDSSEEREKIFYLDKSTGKIVRIPLRTAEALRSRLYFEGKGELTVSGIEHRVRKTGEVRSID